MPLVAVCSRIADRLEIVRFIGDHIDVGLVDCLAGGPGGLLYFGCLAALGSAE